MGNLGRNTFIGPNYWVLDTSLLKNVTVSERLHLQFRIEAFNVFNRTNFLLGDNNIGSPSFGLAGGTHPPRNLQFGLKMSY